MTAQADHGGTSTTDGGVGPAPDDRARRRSGPVRLCLAVALLASSLVSAGTASADPTPGNVSPPAKAPTDSVDVGAVRAVVGSGSGAGRSGDPAGDVAVGRATAALRDGGVARAIDDCFGEVLVDPLHDVEVLDIDAYGAFSDCSSIVFATLTRDAWQETALDAFLVVLDTDMDLATGCDGADLIAAVFADGADLIGGLLATPDCDAASWTLRPELVAFDRDADRDIALAVPVSVMERPRLRWAMALGARYGDIDHAPDAGWIVSSRVALPGTPDGVVATSGTNRLDVRWNRPSGRPESYLVQYRAAPSRTARIIDGRPAVGSDAPWQVALLVADLAPDVGQFCGGSLVGPTQVVTAAHCVVGLAPDAVDVAANVTSLRAVTAADRYAVVDIRIHPDYRGDPVPSSDIAVLTLGRAVPGAVVLALPAAADDPAAGTPVRVSGWGATRRPADGGGPGYPDALQVLDTEVLAGPGARCGDYGTAFDPSLMVCAGSLTAQGDACFGDSGGALVAGIGSRPVMVGIVSWGVGCGEAGYPGVYTRVAAVVDWARRAVGAAAWTTVEVDCATAVCRTSLRGLLADTRYEIRVAAINGGGMGEWSPVLAATTTRPGAAAARTCMGRRATIVAVAGRRTVGTPGPDVIVGTAGRDVIIGGGGDDVICGEGGNDRIRSGGGDDLVDLGAGRDAAHGGRGDDWISGRAGRDVIAGAAGDDQVLGGRGWDALRGGTGADELWGNAGVDRCIGGAGRDRVASCER